MLPAVHTNQEWEAVVWDEGLIRPAAEDLAARLGLAGAGLRRYPDGSRPVYAVGDRLVLKLYPTVSAPDSGTEARVLEYVNGRLPVATPEFLACGEYENGWRYVLMSQLPGTGLAAAWPAIPRPQQDRVVSEVGELLAALHSLDPGPLHGILGPADWDGFVASQRATATERQHKVELPELWLSQIEGFLASVPLVPGQERVLAGYGRGFDPREVLAYTLLHRHSNLTGVLRDFPAPPEPTLESLALTWFGTDDP
jgi:hygromycin-B 7''-O-kinase